MKRFTRICLILAAALLICGLGAAAAGYAGGAINDIRSASHAASGKTERIVVPAENLARLDMSLYSEDVTILPSNDGDLHIEYTPIESFAYEFGLESSPADNGDTYFFNSTFCDSGFHWMNHLLLDFTWNDGSGHVTVYLPEALSMSLETLSGDVEAQDLTSAALSIATTSGKIELQNISAAALDLSSTSGDITANCGSIAGAVSISTVSGETDAASLSIADTLYVSSTSGEIDLASTTVASTEDTAARLHAVSGDISLENVTIQGGLSLSTTSGEITLEPAAVFGNISAGSTSGDVYFHLVDAPAHRIASVYTTSGDISVFGGDDGGAYSISVSTTSGEIYIQDEY